MRNRKAYMPGVKDPNGWENGYVEPQAIYQNTGSQTPIAHDRDGHPIEVEGKGMMKIPGYEWHDKSPQFHKLSSQDRSALIRLASSLLSGGETRKAILASLQKASTAKAAEPQTFSLISTQKIKYVAKYGGTDAVFQASAYKPTEYSTFKDISLVVVLEKVSGSLDLEDWWSGSGYFSDAVKKAFKINLRVKSKYDYTDLGAPIGKPDDEAKKERLVLVY